jgi:hypothetical protein
VANAISPITYSFSTPYLTTDEYRSAPTAIDIDNLVFNSSDPDVQNAELANVIARASSWIDTYCNQILSSTIDTEQQRIRVRPDGTLRFHPDNYPVIALLSFAYGTDPNNLTIAQDCSVAWIENQEIIFPYATISTTYSSQGPLAFGFPSTPRAETFIRYSYINGYANTMIVTATAGATSLTVENGAGFRAGASYKIYDGLRTENVTIASTYTFGSTTLPLTSALLYSHNPGISISGLPPAIKEAAILVTTAMLKVRGDNSMIMNVTTQPSVAIDGSQNIGQDMAMAKELLATYRRIR